jgi:hypothetical protein
MELEHRQLVEFISGTYIGKKGCVSSVSEKYIFIDAGAETILIPIESAELFLKKIKK